jgi:hypothetical protein
LKARPAGPARLTIAQAGRPCAVPRQIDVQGGRHRLASIAKPSHISLGNHDYPNHLGAPATGNRARRAAGELAFVV